MDEDRRFAGALWMLELRVTTLGMDGPPAVSFQRRRGIFAVTAK